MNAAQNEIRELRRSYQNANARAWALQAQCATLEARLGFANNARRAPAPVQGIEYNQHTLKARIRGVYAELTMANDELRSDIGTLRDLQNDPEFLGICHEGTVAGSAFEAIGRVHERLKSSAGVVECGICFDTIIPETAMLGKNCHHLFCIACVESNMEAPNADGVGNMRCPYRCAGIFCNRDHWALFQTSKSEVESEGAIAEVAAAVLETPDDKFRTMVDAGELVIVTFTGQDGVQWEEVVDGPRATRNKRQIDDDPTLHAPRLFKFKESLKKLAVPFKFAKLGDKEAWDALAKECGRNVAWVRRVVPPQA
jgi:hypothetical protein